MPILTNYDGIVRDRFVETGTLHGTTLRLAAQHFKECLSVELDKDLYANALRKFCNVPNVKLFAGHSPLFLREVLNHEISTTFWLDAHYDGCPLPGGVKQCSLMEELYEIVRLNWFFTPIILIDDAEMFISHRMFEKHPGYWKPEEWPKISEIDQLLFAYTRTMREPNVLMYTERPQ